MLWLSEIWISNDWSIFDIFLAKSFVNAVTIEVFDAINTVEGAIVKIKDPMEYLKRLEFHKKSKNFEDYFF